jgi:tyrosyl-tRNA synthetase
VFAFYQFWLNCDDRDAISYLKVYTDVPRQEVDELAGLTATRPEAREAQRRLARDFTTIVHGEAACAAAIRTTEALFGQGRLADVDPAELEIGLQGAPTVRLDPAGGPQTFAHLLVDAGLATSLSDADRAVAGGGVYANDERIEASRAQPAPDQFLGGRLLVLRRGRRNRAVVLRDG